MTSELAVRLAIAALVGLAVGVEREWSGHGDRGLHPRFAGVRTFLLMGAIGGVSGWLVADGWLPVAVTLLAGSALLVAAAYFSAARAGGAEAVDGTTEVAALVVLALGVLAGIGQTAVAGGAGTLMVLALMEKAAIQGAVKRLDESELRGAFLFAALGLVVLPVLPHRSFGPLGGFNPRALWIVVLIFSGINYAGFIARRLVGPSRGYGVTGALGGVVSSTAVALQFARLSRDRPHLGLALATGTVAASTVLLPRVVIVSYLLTPAVSLAVLPYLVPPFVVGALAVGVLLWRARGAPADGAPPDRERNPLRLGSAIQMALAFQLALMGIEWVRAQFGSSGVLATAALLGLTDMDALTLSMNQLGRDPDQRALAAMAVGVGVAANAVMKLTLTLILGAGRYRWAASGGLAALLASGALAIVLAAR
jgi:uncharacterized membrane protein (DUF4010 family)